MTDRKLFPTKYPFRKLIISLFFVFISTSKLFAQDPPTTSITPNDTTICANASSLYINFALATNDSAVKWTSYRSSSISPIDNDTTYYSPSASAISTGTDTLYLIAYPFDSVSTHIDTSRLIVRLNNPPDVYDIANPTACISYTLPAIDGLNLSGGQAYYEGPNAAGIKYLAGESISSNTLLYIYDSIGSCYDQENFNITIVTPPIVDDITNVTACNSYTLPSITGTNLSGGQAFYTLSGAGGTKLVAGQTVSNSTTLFIHDSIGNCHDEESFIITIVASPNIANPGNQTSCTSYTLPAISGTNLSGGQAYYTAASAGGAKHIAGESISSNTLLYIYDSIGSCYDQENFNVTIVTPPIVNDITNVTACNSYTLPTITGTNLSGGEAFYTATLATGTKYIAGQIISSSMTLFIHDSIGSCHDEENFTITIVASPVITNPDNQTSCDSYTLPAIAGSNLSGGQAYYTAALAGGEKHIAGESISSTQTLYIYDSIGSCYDQKNFTVTIVNSPAINAIANQSVCNSYTLPTITGTNLTANRAYFTASGGLGVRHVAGDIISTSTTLFIYDINGICSDEQSFIITVTNTPNVNDHNDTIVCDTYTLPAITGTNLSGNQAYYTGSGGVGTKFIAGEVISTTRTLYIYDSNGSCSDQEQFIITVNSTPALNNPGNQIACDSYTLPGITGVNLTGNQAYYTETAGGGTKYIAGQAIAASTTLYIYDTNGSCSDQENFTISIIASPIINDIANPTVCNTYVLPTITGTNLSGNQAFYTATGGAGTKYTSGESISNSTLLYIYDSNGSCSDEENFTITIVASPAVNDIPNQSVCDSYTLPTITGSNLTGNEAYYTLSGGLGVKRNATDVISSTTTLFIYDINGSCNDEESFTITITNTPSVNDISNPTVCDIYTLPSITGTNLTGNEAFYTASGGAGTKYIAGQTISSTRTLYIYDSNGNCSSEEQFTITVNGTPSINNPGNQVVCDAYTLPTITGTNLSGGQAYYTAPTGGGSKYNEGVTLTNSATLYIYDSNGSCSDQKQFTLSIIHSPNITNPGNQTACNSYTLPTINGTDLSGLEAYYTAPSGSGFKYNTGDVISSTKFLYIYDTNGSCDNEENFTVTILPPPVITNPGPQTDCGNYTLPAIGGSNLSGNQAYFTASDGNGTRYDAGDVIASSVVLYIYDNNGYCSNQVSFSITIQPEPIISAGSDRSICGLNSYTLQGGGSNYDSNTIEWIKIQGGGILAPLTGDLNPVYTPVIGDYGNTVQLRMTVKGLGPCSGTTYQDDVYLYYSDHIIVNAGPATAIICEVDSYTTSASTNTPSTYIWTNNGGDGEFANDDQLNTVYTPGDNDKANGTVTLTLTATGAGTCLGNASDDIVLQIKKLPTVKAGPISVTICETGTYTTSDATASNYDNFAWSIREGGGSISTYDLNTSEYIPGQVAIDQGYAILRLRVTSLSPCFTTYYDDIRINLSKEPEITVGTIPTLCVGVPYQVTIVDTTYSSAVAWSLISGTGPLADGNTISPTYTPTATDAINGTITLRLVASATSPCTDPKTQNIIFQVAAAPTVELGADITVCEGTSSIALNPTATNDISWSWTKTGGDGINSFSNRFTKNTIYNPSAADYTAGTVRLTLVVTGSALCSSTVTDFLDVHFTPAPTATIIAIDSVCAGSSKFFSTASATNYASISWAHDGAGTLSVANPEKPTYTSAAADAGKDLNFTMTVNGNGTCNAAVAHTILRVLKPPTISMIDDVSICGNSFHITGVQANDYSALLWTKGAGDGTFNPNPPTGLSPIYTLGTNDIAAGFVQLTLTATAISPCAANASDNFIIHVVDAPVANAGPDITICETQNYVTNSATSNNASTYLWEIVDGSGILNNSSSLQGASYQPSNNDKQVGSFKLKLTAYGDLSCPTHSDDVNITIQKQPVITIENPTASVCLGTPYQIPDAHVYNELSLIWTTNGAYGSLADINTEKPTYTPHINDITLGGGTVTLTLTAYPNTECTGDVVATKTLTILKQPTAFAGTADYACAGSDYEIQSATATFASDYVWTATGGGSFSNNHTLQPTYHVNDADAARGWVDITLTAIPISPCFTSTPDIFRLTILAGPTAYAGVNATICHEDSYLIPDSDTTNATSLLWIPSGDGTFDSPTSLHPRYTPGTNDKINGSVTLTLHAYGIGSNGCNHDVSDLNLTINKLPTANAGSMTTICEGTNVIQGATAANNNGVLWTKIQGAGTLLYTNNIQPTFNASIGSAGTTVVLQLAALPKASCTDTAFSTISLFVLEPPTVDITVTNDAVCGRTSYSLSGLVTSNDLINNTFVWTSSGSGTFSDINSPTPNYLPSAADVIAGAVTLRVTASNSACNNATDFMTLNIESVTVDAGPDAIVCAGSDYTFDPTIIGNHGTITWSILNGTGAGTFSNSNDPTATYFYAPGDAGNTVDFQISIVKAGECTGGSPATSVISVEFKNAPIVTAGIDSTICENEIFVFPLAHATESNTTNVYWTTLGDGIFSGGGTHPTYVPGEIDLAQGYVDLTIHGTNSPCQEVTDVMRLSFSRLPIVDAGSNASADIGTTFTVSTATASNYSSLRWYINADDGGTDDANIGVTLTVDPLNPLSPQVAILDKALGHIIKLTLEATPAGSCTEPITDYMLITIGESPLIDFNASSTCENEGTIFKVDEEITDIGKISSYTWDFGDGNKAVSILDTIIHYYSVPDLYTVTLEVIDTLGYTSILSHDFEIKGNPSVHFDYTQACSGTPTQFTVNTGSADITDYIWNFNDGSAIETITFGSNPNIEHTFPDNNPYEVSLQVISRDGCSAELQKTILVIEPPISNFNYSDTCLGALTKFNDASIGVGNSEIIKWIWDFGDPTTGANNISEEQNPSHIFSVAGTYLVNLQTENINGCIDDTTMSLTIIAPPIIDFQNTVACLNEEVSFTPTSNPNYLYSWNFGDGTPTANYEAPMHKYEGQGPYEVVLTVIDTTTNCSSTVSHPLSFDPLPTAVFSISEERCMNQTIQFTNHSDPGESSIKSWEWKFGDGSDTTILKGHNPNISHAYKISKDYTVTLIVTNANDCQDSVQSLINIKAAPKVNFEYDISCFEGKSSFTDLSYSEDGSPIIQWLWDFGDPLSGNSNTATGTNNPTHTFLTDTANVYLQVTNENGCSSDTTILIISTVLEDVEFEISGGTCLKNETTFEITKPIDLTNYIVEWNFGDPLSGQSNTSNNKVNPSHIYISTGQYQVILTIIDQNGCSNSFTRAVNIKPLPGARFDTDAPSCLGKEVKFTYFYEPNGSIIDSLLWEFGDGTDTIVKRGDDWNVSHLYSTAEEKNTKLTVYTQNGCVAESSIKKINILRGPIANFFATTVCIDHFAQFTDFSQEGEGGTIMDWQWNFGDSISGSNTNELQNPTHKYENSGAYEVSLTIIDVQGCTDDTTKLVEVRNTVEPKPFTFDTLICVNTTAEFFMNNNTNLGDVEKIIWDFGDLGSEDNEQIDVVNPTHTYNTPGKYTITLTLDNSICGGTIDTTITVSPKPIANFEYFNSCVGKPTEFTDLSIYESNPIENWNWNFGVQNLTNDTSTLQDPLYTYRDTGTYLVSLEVSNNAKCTDIRDSLIEITPTPTAKFSFAETGQGEITFTNESTNATAYEWDFGDYFTSDEVNPIHQYDSAGTLESSKYAGPNILNLQLISMNDSECADTAIHLYDLYFKGLYIPTAFIPSSTNPSLNVFKPVGVNLRTFNIEVYSSWGEMVWRSTPLDEDGRPFETALDKNGSPTEYWDGKSRGSDAPSGPYLWKARGVFKDGTIWKGNDLNNTGSGSTSGTVILIR